jgi:hypothetical protein
MIDCIGDLAFTLVFLTGLVMAVFAGGLIVYGADEGVRAIIRLLLAW